MTVSSNRQNSGAGDIDRQRSKQAAGSCVFQVALLFFHGSK
jgi:hypothetical protein